MKTKSISFRYGIGLAIALIAYFLILSLFGLHIYIWYSLFNGILTGIGIFLALRAYRTQNKNSSYGKGFMTGFLTGFTATVIFTCFFALYSTYINPDFTEAIIEHWDMASDMGLGQIIFVVAVMGFVSSFILTLVCSQYLKDSWNAHSKKDKLHQKKSRLFEPQKQGDF